MVAGVLGSAMTTALVVGAGSVGRGWAALLIAHGHRVIVIDPYAAEQEVWDSIDAFWPTLPKPTASLTPDRSMLAIGSDLETAAAKCGIAFENGPENLEFKAAMLARIDAAMPPDGLILSSSGGIRPTDLQRACANPGRVLVAHPFNPPHLVPLVEIIGGAKTDPANVIRAREFVASLGKRPIVVQREVVGHLANRFQAALMQEVFHCLINDVASAADIDDALRFGLGLRWALMGGIMTFNLAGGPGGAAHTLDLAAQAYTDWWADLGKVELTDKVRERIVAAAGEVEAGRDRRQWAQWRDEALVDIIRIQNDRIDRQ